MAYWKRTLALATALSALAGYIDAIGFISLGGFFVSFMTGNSTRLGVDIARANPGGIAVAGGVIATFIGGVVIGALIARFAGRYRRLCVLAWVTLCLGIAAVFDRAGAPQHSTAALLLAMAASNCVFQRNGEVTIGVTYMTGALVKMGQQIANALTGGPPWAWLRNFALWLGLMLGAVAGATAYDAFGGAAIWFAAGASAFLAFVSLVLPADAD